MVLVVRRWPGGIKKVHPKGRAFKVSNEKRKDFWIFLPPHTPHIQCFSYGGCLGYPPFMRKPPHGFDFSPCFQDRYDRGGRSQTAAGPWRGIIGMLGGGLFQKFTKNYGPWALNPMLHHVPPQCLQPIKPWTNLFNLAIFAMGVALVTPSGKLNAIENR